MNPCGSHIYYAVKSRNKKRVVFIKKQTTLFHAKTFMYLPRKEINFFSSMPSISGLYLRAVTLGFL